MRQDKTAGLLEWPGTRTQYLDTEVNCNVRYRFYVIIVPFHTMNFYGNHWIFFKIDGKFWTTRLLVTIFLYALIKTINCSKFDVYIIHSRTSRIARLLYLSWNNFLGPDCNPYITAGRVNISSHLLSRASLECDRCFLKCSFKSLLTPTSWNIRCNLDVYSNPQACCNGKGQEQWK